MSELIQTIKSNLNDKKRQRLSYEELVTIIQSESTYNDIESVIDNLELEGIIYYKDGLYYEFPNDLRTGQIECTRKKTYFLNDIDGEKIFIDDKDLNGALPYDTVVFRVDDTGVAHIDKILKRKSPNIVCEIQENESGLFLHPHNIKGSININVNKDALNKIGAGEFVLVKVDNEMKRNTFSGEIVKKIELNGQVDKALALIAFANDFEVDYPQEVMTEANAIPNEVTKEEIEERKEFDFRDELIFTIDGVDTKDMDDAVSIKILPNGNYELGVHIANVSHYIKYGTNIFEEAQKRGTSVYILNTVLPMLPAIISNGICSLNSNVDRLTKSVIMEIDHEGRVINSKICDAVINSKKKMNYDDVNKILEEDIIPEGYEPFVDTLKQMNALSKILTSKRRNQGKIDFVSSEIKIALDDEGKPIYVEPRQCLSAEKMIENLMVTANEEIASYVEWMDMPFVYRTHEGPNKYKLEEALRILNAMGYKIQTKEVAKKPKLVQRIMETLKDEEAFPVISGILLKGMSRAKYSNNNEGHFALASDAYTHFTSPIRRFPDLMVHSLLDYYNEYALGNVEITNEDLEELEQRLEKECEYASMKERQAEAAEYEADRSKIIAFMKEKVGNYFEAVITMINEQGISITTDDGIYGVVSFSSISGDFYLFHPQKYTAVGRNTKTKYKIGNRVSVRLKRVDEVTGNLYFQIESKIQKLSEPKNLTLEKN